MCESCDAVYAECGTLKGVVHEHGCPDAWKDKRIECKWCGCDFLPEEHEQILCSESCSDSYYN